MENQTKTSWQKLEFILRNKKGRVQRKETQDRSVAASSNSTMPSLDYTYNVYVTTVQNLSKHTLDIVYQGLKPLILYILIIKKLRVFHCNKKSNVYIQE